jgi:hypothetical protein
MQLYSCRMGAYSQAGRSDWFSRRSFLCGLAFSPETLAITDKNFMTTPDTFGSLPALTSTEDEHTHTLLHLASTDVEEDITEFCVRSRGNSSIIVDEPSFIAHRRCIHANAMFAIERQIIIRCVVYINLIVYVP